MNYQQYSNRNSNSYPSQQFIDNNFHVQPLTNGLNYTVNKSNCFPRYPNYETGMNAIPPIEIIRQCPPPFSRLPNSFVPQSSLDFQPNRLLLFPSSPNSLSFSSFTTPPPFYSPEHAIFSNNSNSTSASTQKLQGTKDNSLMFPPHQAFACIPHINTEYNRNFKFKTKNQNNYKCAKKTEFHCENCDRNFFNEEKYQNHISEHTTCNRNGCSFTAHPKIVDKHISMQHRSGLYNRIVKGYTPEEIDQWISDRKKQYPTKEKIKQKQLQQEEMENRGERYAESNKYFLKNRRIKGKQNRFNKLRHKSQQGKKKLSFTKNPLNSSDNSSANNSKHSILYEGNFDSDSEDNSSVINLPPFRGIEYYSFEVDGIENEKLLSAILKLSPIDINEYKMSTNLENAVMTNCTPNLNVKMNSSISNLHIKADVSCSTVKETCDLSESKEILQNKKLCSNSQKTTSNSLDLLKCYKSDESESDIITDSENEVVCDYVINECNSSNSDSNPDNLMPSHNLLGFEISAYPENEIVKENTLTSPKRISKSRKRRKKRNNDINPTSKPETTIEKLTNTNFSTEDQRNKYSESNINLKNELSVDNSEKLTSSIFSHHKRYRPPTLLEKLLAPEIRHERNVILQCVKYVVQNNYFQNSRDERN